VSDAERGRTPRSTYRVQVRHAFDLHSTAELVDYLAELGADWVYLSPLLEAEPGSDHGYDVIRHGRVDPERGGDAGLTEAARTAHGAGLGVLVDIVPNHMGVASPKLNDWWWDVLTNGRESRYAQAFDIDWDFGKGKLRVPVLGDGDEDLAALTVENGELAYYDNRFPIAPGTGGGTPQEVHARQSYELVNWRRADYDLNYRRFFAVNTLAGLRVEVPEVFDESHALIRGWIENGLVDGLRIDHPDGLFDPGDYLARLADATGGVAAPDGQTPRGGVYVLVEKILEGDELLPDGWATAGTTGYDALGEFDRVLVDPAGQAGLDALADRLQGRHIDWHELVHQTKRAVADGILRSEVLRLVRTGVWELPDDVPTEAVADAIAELLTDFPVYRSYLPQG
jgi:(1->4)-alpha-D-glucan 1-alpha-D-glucosylmutase